MYVHEHRLNNECEDLNKILYCNISLTELTRLSCVRTFDFSCNLSNYSPYET
jgi:hypothetical protein